MRGTPATRDEGATLRRWRPMWTRSRVGASGCAAVAFGLVYGKPSALLSTTSWGTRPDGVPVVVAGAALEGYDTARGVNVTRRLA